MKKSTNYIYVFMLALIMVACNDNSEPEIRTIGDNASDYKEVAFDPSIKYAKAEFEIKGMTCAMGCAKTIEKKLAKMEGVKSAKVDFNQQIAMVEFNEAKVTPTTLEEAVAKAGKSYKVNNMKTVDQFSTEQQCENACCSGKSDEDKLNCDMACCASEKM